MTATMANVAHTMSDCDLSYVYSGASTAPDAVLVRHKSYEVLPPFLGSTPIIRIDREVPAWYEPTADLLKELLLLEPDWDSYGALPVDPAHVYTMLKVLAQVMRDETPAPSVAPTNRGGVQVEWHERGIDLEVETLSTDVLRVSFEDSATGIEWDREIGADLSPLNACIAPLSLR